MQQNKHKTSEWSRWQYCGQFSSPSQSTPAQSLTTRSLFSNQPFSLFSTPVLSFITLSLTHYPILFSSPNLFALSSLHSPLSVTFRSLSSSCCLFSTIYISFITHTSPLPLLHTYSFFLYVLSQYSICIQVNFCVYSKVGYIMSLFHTPIPSLPHPIISVHPSQIPSAHTHSFTHI